MGGEWGDIWQDVVTTQAAPGRPSVLAALALALVVVSLPRPWGIARHALTIAHEGSHAVAALITGRRLAGIRLHSDTSGLTVSRGRPTGPGMVLTAFAGYVGPALLGVGGAYLLGAGHALAVLWLAVLLLALLLLQIRNFYGLYVVLVAGLLVLELQHQRRRGRGATSDADILARLTHLPGILWVAIFLLVTLGSLGLGGRALVA